MNESRLVEKESDSELSELRKMFPEITDEEIQDIENQIENEELWDEETLSRAVEIYTEKKDVSKESASEVKPEEKGLTDKKKKVQDILKEKHPDLNFYVSESENEINLSKIIVPKESRNEGKGSKFTEDLIAYADSVGKRIVLTPSKDFGGSVTRLKKFYKSFGFKENKGKSRDFTTQESFIRDPLVQKAEEESGGEKVRSLSKGIEADAIEKGLVEDLGDLPTYAQRNMKEVAERSLGLINKDPELAKKIAFREVPEQDGYRAEELYTALRVKAIAEGDVDMIMRLSSDESASIGTEAGQRVKALDSKNENDPVRAIKEIEKERTEYSKKTPSHKKADKVSKLEIRVKELEERLNKTQKDLAEATTKRKAKKRTQFGSKNTIFTNEGLDEARESLKHKMSGLHAGLDPTVVVDLTQIGGFYFEGGVRSFAEWSAMIKEEFGDRINPYLKRVWREVNKKYNENKIQEIEKKLSIAIASEKEVSDVSYLAQELSEHLISGGIVDRKNLVTEVQKILKEYFPSISKRQTADAISGYGKYTELSDDKVKALLRDIKGQLQQVSKLEDMQSGKAPLKTGVERRAVSDEERRLIKLVEESKKKYNIQTTDPDKQLKSALESYKTRLKNQIKDLEKQIHDRKKIVKGKTPLKLDVEASNLIEKKNVLKKVFVQVFGRSGLSQEQRIRMAENALKKSIAEYERRIRERDISPKEKGTPVSTRSLNALRSKRDSLKHQYENFKKSVIPKKSSQEIALQSLKTRLTNESKRLETRIEEMDFEETQKREILLDVQAKKLKEKRDQAKEAYNAAKYVKENLTKDEVGKIVELSKKASEAKAKVVESGDWTADNKDQVLEYFVSKQKFEDYVESLKPIDTKDVVNNAIDYFRASILASPRILRNSFLYQIIPGIERSITKRIVTGAFSDADLQSNIVEKLQAKLSGVTPTKKGMDFIKRQVAMAIEIYHKTGFDISRMDKLGKYPKFFGENVGKIRGDSVFARYARMVNLAPKWLAGGTDMLFANIGRADTVIMMSKEIAKVESMKGVLPEGMSEEERADQLLKDSYSFDPKDKRANDVRDAGIMDAHMMNNTQPGSWSDFVIDMRKRMKIGSIHFGKAIVPFAKIANVVVAEGVKTATGYGVAKSIYNINNASKQANQADRAKLMRRAVTDLVRYVGLSGATLIMTALLDDDDYVGAYDAISPKEYYLARSRGGGTNYIRIGGKWLSLRYLPMINIPISAVMAARQAKSRNDSPIAGYLKGMMGNVLEAPGIKETKTILQRVGWSVKADNMEKMAENLHLDWDGLSNWAKVRMIPSVLSYDVWNALFPKNSKYDFMGREIERGGVFRDDKSNEITLEFNRLANNGAFPVISDPSGAYAVSLEEKMGEEEYSKKLASYKKEYAEKVLKKIRTRRYKKETDKEKKKIIDSLRKEEVLEKLKKADRKIK